MTTRNLEAMFAPSAIALIGASNEPGTVGAVLARNLMESGFAGPVLAVNPHDTAIRSTLSYLSLAELPMAPDLAVIATPPATVPGITAELAARGCRVAVVITAGFGEAGGAGEDLRQQMLDAARPHLMRIVGPNCLGIISSAERDQRQLRAADAQAGAAGAGRAVWRNHHRRARLGRRARLRLLAHRHARRHGRRRLRRHAGLPGARRGDARRPALRREHHRCAQVHVGGAGGGARQASGGDQGWAQRRRRQGGSLAHRRAGRRRRGLRRGVPARRAAAGVRTARAVRRG